MKNTLETVIPTLLLILVAAYFFPWKNISWGKVQYEPANIISVSGYADSSQTNQTATYNLTVTQTNNDKQKAVDAVNQDISGIIESLKQFGIPQDNIKTQSMNIYQNQYYDNATQRSVPSDWSASSTIEVKYEFTDQGKAAELSRMLASTPATNVWGPNFSVGSNNSLDTQKDLLDAAIKDAREKAEIIARSSGRSLGKIVSVSESGFDYVGGPIMYERAMGGGAGGNGFIEPGVSNISKTVNVVFELK